MKKKPMGSWTKHVRTKIRKFKEKVNSGKSSYDGRFRLNNARARRLYLDSELAKSNHGRNR